MKKLAFLLFLLSCPFMGQSATTNIPGSQFLLVAIPSNNMRILLVYTNGGLNSDARYASNATITYIDLNNLILAGAATNSVKLMSTLGSHNEYTDMRATTNELNNVRLGMSLSGPNNEAYIWSATGPGLGSNVWGASVSYPGGIKNIGNPYWQDLPASLDQDQGFYWGYGPAKSAQTNAFRDVTSTNGPTTQPGLQVVNANPYTGYAWIGIRGAFTNNSQSIDKFLIGSDNTGVPIYGSQYGYTLGELSDAYGLRSNGILTQLGRWAQQAPSFNQILSKPYQDYYISMNMTRVGDVFNGQAPLFAISTTNWESGHAVVGFPKWIPNVWVVAQTNGHYWNLVSDYLAGTVSVTNAVFEAGHIVQNDTNNGSVIIGRDYTALNDALLEVNGPAHFNLPAQIYAENGGAFTFDASTFNRFGIAIQWGFYPVIGHASGSPFAIAQFSGSDLQTGLQSQTRTNELTIGADSVTTIWKPLILASNTTFTATVTGGDGAFWNSNKVLYWVTATKTNLVSDGR